MTAAYRPRLGSGRKGESSTEPKTEEERARIRAEADARRVERIAVERAEGTYPEYNDATLRRLIANRDKAKPGHEPKKGRVAARRRLGVPTWSPWAKRGAQSHKVSRNAPCSCGSGLKYKRCCG